MSRKEHKYHFIYKTIDTRNGKFYIGMHSTDNLNDGYVGSGTRLKKLIYKYGKEIFNMEILEFLPNRSSLKEREKEIVNSDLLKEERCMNLKPGGEGGFNNEDHRILFFKRAKELSEINSKKGTDGFKRLMKNPEWRKEQIKKQKEGSKKYFETHEGIWTGKKHSLETIQKMKKSKNVGINNPQYGTCWITNGIDNKKIKKTDFIPENWKLGKNQKKIEKKL